MSASFTTAHRLCDQKFGSHVRREIASKTNASAK